MVDISLIQEAFGKLIGFRRGIDQRDSDMDSDLCESITGMFVDEAHALFTATNLEATMDENVNFVAVRHYDNGITYNKWDLVKTTDHNYFYSLVNNNVGQATTNTNYWKPTTLYSHYLRIKRNASVVNLINKIRSGGKIAGNKEILESGMLYYGGGRHEKEKHGRFVGFMLTLQEQDLAMVIPRIILEFKQAQTIPIYVYHSTSNTAVATYSLNYTMAGRQQSFLLSSELALRFNHGDIGGHYLIGYYESDLTDGNKAIYSDELPFNGKGCSSCNNRSISSYLAYQPYVDVKSIQVDAGFITAKPSQTWMEEDIVIIDAQSWGLNLAFTIKCDLTNFYISKKELFSSALRAQIRLDFLEIIAHNTRNKGHSDMIRSQAFAELKSEQNPYKELENAIKDLTLDMSGLNKVCLPCIDKKNSFKFGSVWR